MQKKNYLENILDHTSIGKWYPRQGDQIAFASLLLVGMWLHITNSDFTPSLQERISYDEHVLIVFILFAAICCETLLPSTREGEGTGNYGENFRPGMTQPYAPPPKKVF